MTARDSYAKRLSALLCAALLTNVLLSACADTPSAPLSAPQSPMAQRQMETRRYEGIGEQELLAACAGVLQDLGFTLDRTEPRLGLITASKQREAGSTGTGPRPFGQFGLGRWGGFGGIGLSFGLGSFGGESRPLFDRDQTIRVTLVSRPAQDAEGRPLTTSHLVRVNFQRVVHRSDDSVHAEPLTDPKVYQTFHERLAKSVFLEAQQQL